jgi:hypothetical protein
MAVTFYDATGRKLSSSTATYPDDTALVLGTSSDASLIWETADANANALIVALPDGGATNVPVLAVGDQSIINADLGFFNGYTQPVIAAVDADNDSWIGIGHTADDVPALRTNKTDIMVDLNGATAWGLADHSARHEWDGADKINVQYLLLATKPTWLLEGDSGVTCTVTDSGWASSHKFAIFGYTGTTINSTAGSVFTGNRWHSKTEPVYCWISSFAAMLELTDKIEAWAGWFAANNALPTATSNHYGFKFISTVDGTNAVLSATNGDGATEKATVIVASVAPYEGYYLMVIYKASTIYYYYSTDAVTWTLGATHVDNIPTGVSLYSGMWVKNTEAVDKMCQLTGFKVGNNP